MLMNVKITACSEPWLLGGFQLDILKRQRPSSFLVLFFITVKFVRVPLVLVSRRLAFIQPKPLPLIRVLLQKFFIISCWVLSSPSTKEESKNHRLICMHFLSRAICRRLLLRCFIGFTEKLTITNWIVAVPTLVEERIPLGLTGNSSSSQQRHRHFSFVVLHTFVAETILSEWRKFCTNLERALPGLTRSFIKKNCLPSQERHRHFSSGLLPHFLVETILLEWRKFCTNFNCKRTTQHLVASLTFYGVAFCFKSFISSPETWTNREAAILYRMALCRYEHPAREVFSVTLSFLSFPFITWRFIYIFLFCYGEYFIHIEI